MLQPRRTWLFAGSLLALSSRSPTARAAPSINVAVQASFSSPPYLLELLETAAEENPTCYFPILDRIAEGYFSEQSTDSEVYNAFLKLLEDERHLASQDALSTFKLALSLHSAVPRIEAQYQYYRTTVESALPLAQDAACPVWVHTDGKQYCSPALGRAQQDVSDLSDTDALPFDRLTTLHEDLPLSTLYADINSPLFSEFHQSLSQAAITGQKAYRLRYRPSTESRPLTVSGYGVELALKKTDYIVIDDRDAQTGGEEVTKNEDVLLGSEEIADLKPLSSSQLLGLGLKASTFVLASEDPFDSLVRLSQDFPKHSSLLSRLNVSANFYKEHQHNRGIFLPAGINVVWINGMQIDTRQMNAYSLLDTLRNERALINGFKELGMTGPEAVSLLSQASMESSKGEDKVQRYDYRDTIDGGNVVIWLNDLEKDKRYEGWPRQASVLLQRTYPGQLPPIARDIFNVVVPLDLMDLKDIQLLVENMQTFVTRMVPIRFGIVPIVKSPASVEQAKMIYHLQETYGLKAVMSYLAASIKGNKVSSFSEAAFDQAVQDRKARVGKSVQNGRSVLSAADSVTRVDRVKGYLKRLGADRSNPILFVNGVVVPRDDNWLQSMSSRVETDLRGLQRRIYEEVVEEDAWLAGQFLEAAITHRNALIIPENENSVRVVDVSQIVKEHHEVYDRLPRISASEDIVKQFWSQVIVVADVDSTRGAELVKSAMDFGMGQPEAEIMIIHNPSDTGNNDFVSAQLYEILVSTKILDHTMIRNIVSGDSAGETKINPGESHQMADSFWHDTRSLISALQHQPGENGIILNGRVLGPIPYDVVFDDGDMVQLLEYERSKRISPVHTAIAALGIEDRVQTPLMAARITSLIARSGMSDVPEGIYESQANLRMDGFKEWSSEYTVISTGDNETAVIQIVASVDIATEIAQRWIPILRVLSELGGVHMKLYLNPRERMQELTVKRFYRYVLESEPSFGADGSVKDTGAKFDGLPKEALLNLGLDVPPAWLVAPKISIHDLDNIKMSALKKGMNVDAIYELESILIEGHARDIVTGQPPRGVQLLLGTESDPHFADTIIMANVGYFQFKANPGHWKISLQPGRSMDIFNIDSVGSSGQLSSPGDTNTDVTLMSFQGKTLFPRLSRKAGQEDANVLVDDTILGSAKGYVNKASSFASSMLSNIGINTGIAKSQVRHADINIFSVASGHLYERMLNIMMVSVMRHAKHTVKFWFIEQFLSPSFKSFLPDLAEAYGFEYEMVTYKWPHWLRGQTEKQREIWGYKILFLDVLFPVSLDKVIFVDADQIVRTDMYELVTHDLEGAPYGFTPMCDSRTEMEGFRFWKQGYWKTYLRGLPYHISALYVVDLKKFRQIAAGDRLRQQYHQLSADPASLSNLDQDLPNHMQMSLPIHSLPQEWLWCETWCSDESLKQAKTIDLCNNPMTREPKLTRARRQVPEWTVYDEEIEQLRQKTIKSQMGEDPLDEVPKIQDSMDLGAQESTKSMKAAPSVKEEL
ncbi:hypothetical protein MMC25_001386 [Agyrium rufum]|nr:hypothetical protein [Agyrium rufum]